MNNTEIPDAFRANLPKRKILNTMSMANKTLYEKMLGTSIKNIQQIYGFVFKNIHTDRKFVCDVDNYQIDDNNYYKDRNFRKLFLNRDGFSLSESFAKGKEPEITRTDYVHNLSPSDFMIMLKRLSKYKNEILSAIDKDSKKNVVIRFLNAFEQSECDKIFDAKNEFHSYKQMFGEHAKKIWFYDENENMEQLTIYYLKCQEAQQSLQISQASGWGTWRKNTIALNDLEKCSQIYDEIVEFLNGYYNHLDVQDKSLTKFYTMLKDSFAKELILESLKEQK